MLCFFSAEIIRCLNVHTQYLVLCKFTQLVYVQVSTCSYLIVKQQTITYLFHYMSCLLEIKLHTDHLGALMMIDSLIKNTLS